MAVGKSTTARILRELLARWPDTPRVELVTTDGFLYPNAELERRGLMQRKGFPESYDRRALLRFVAEVKSGAAEVARPGLLPPDLRHRARASEIVVRRPDVLIVEGLNVLQPRPGPARRAAPAWPSATSSTSRSTSTPGSSDIRALVRRAVPAAARDRVRRPRLVLPPVRRALRRRGRATAERIWATINEPNLVENILPTRGRATLVLTKGEDHSVRRVRLRKL